MANDTNTTVYIVFPIFNRLSSTKLFLQSLGEQSASNYKLVICDDGSTDGTSEYLSTHHPDVTVLEGNGQLWWTAGMNKCIQHVLSICADTDFILTLNNDSILPTNYIEQKLARASDHPTSIIGSLCVYEHDRNLIETSGYIVDFDKPKLHHVTKPGELRTSAHQGTIEVSYLPGKGVLIPSEVFRNIGLYDEVNLPQYHADTDLVLRAFKEGYAILLDFDSIIYSEVNTGNMVLPDDEITIKSIIKTFIGPYSMNNFFIYNNFAKKHFPNNRFKYLACTYTRTVGGLARRYLKYRLGKLKAIFH